MTKFDGRAISAALLTLTADLIDQHPDREAIAGAIHSGTGFRVVYDQRAGHLVLAFIDGTGTSHLITSVDCNAQPEAWTAESAPFPAARAN